MSDDDRAYWIGPEDDPELVCGECVRPGERDNEADSTEAVGESCCRCGAYWEYADEAPSGGSPS